MDKNTIFKVKNRSDGRVIYTIPEMNNLRREFGPSEVKDIAYGELEALCYLPGGLVLVRDYLQIMGQEALETLNINVEPEYNMSEEDIVKLLTQGSQDEFLDALDFAPDGVIDLIKRFAVQLPLNDVAKREALKKVTGFDTEAAIANDKASKEPDTAEEAAKPVGRRVQKDAPEAGRRTQPKYTVVSGK